MRIGWASRHFLRNPTKGLGGGNHDSTMMHIMDDHDVHHSARYDLPPPSAFVEFQRKGLDAHRMRIK